MRDILDVRMILAVFHLLFVVPLFLFVGYQRSDTPQWVYVSLLSIGGVVMLYHGARLIQRYGRSSMAWVNMLHVILVGPLLCGIGWFGRETPRWAYEVLLMTAFGAGGYHLFQLVKGLEAFQEGANDRPIQTQKGGSDGLYSF